MALVEAAFARHVESCLEGMEGVSTVVFDGPSSGEMTA